MTTPTRSSETVTLAARRSPCRPARCAAGTVTCPTSCGPGAAPTSSCPASPPCATWTSCRPTHVPLPSPHPRRGDQMSKSQPQGYQLSAFRTLYDKAAEFVDRKIGWYRLPVPLGLAVLGGLRDVLRSRNLYDTSTPPAVNLPPVAPATPEVRTNQTLDGPYNELSQPRMGMAGSRFGRNVPLEYTEPEPLPRMMQPSPREVSRALLTRTELIPATSVNALVASWLQFMIHDWFSHGKGPRYNP